MGGGGKGGTSTSTVSIPPEVLARYNAVNARAEEVAKTPFQAYGGEFVAPMNEVQQQGVSQTQQYSGAAQPYYQTAAGLTQQAVDATKPLTAAQIQQYQNPYVQSVVDPTLAALRQQQAQDRQAQTAQAIRSGAFGGERAGLQRAVLGGQQELAQAQAISPLYAQAYNQALAAAQQQQQQRTAGLMGAGQQIAGIGTGAQQAGLQGAQAVIGAGTLGQQTKQALDTAQYQQFLQERGYPFQTAQFLANIAEGTGALSGSTTTTTQPTSFFSDKRLKHNIKKIGKTNDGLPIYSFKYNGDDRTQIGLMAQDVEKKRPEAVGLAGGYKTVDYAKATAGARHARAAGGLVPSSMGGAVFEPGNYARGGFAGGGGIDDILAMQARMYGQGGDQSTGGSGLILPYASKVKGGLGIPNVARDPYRQVLKAAPPSQQQQYGFRQAMGDISAAGSAASTLSSGWDKLTGTKPNPTKSDAGAGVKPSTDQPSAASPPPAQPDTSSDPSFWDKTKSFFGIGSAYGGGIMPRHHFAGGGFLDPYKPPSSGSMVPEDVMESSEETKDEAEKLQPKASGTGGGGGGGGLGSALGVAKTAFDVGKFILPFFGLKDGGSVYGHFADGGVVPRQAFGGDVPGGTVQQPDDTANYFSTLAKQYNLPEDYLPRTYQIESSGGKNLASDKSTARGPFQFIGGTARDLGLDDPMDFRKSADAAARYAAQNRDKLIAAGIENPTAAHLYLAHQQGPQGAINLLTNPNQPAANYVGRTALTNNDIHPEASGAEATNKIFGLFSGTKIPDRQQYPFQRQVQGGLEAAKNLSDRLVPLTYKGEERKGGWGDFLTSRDFILPLMAGLGTMASSPSRYLGAAVLQGLGGAAQAYQGVQKSQVDRDSALAQQMVGLGGIMPPYVTGEIREGKLSGKPITESLPKSLTGVEAPGGGIVGGFTSAVKVDDNPNAYNYTVGPTQPTLANTARLLGTTNFNPINVQTQLALQNKTAANEAERQRVDARLAALNPQDVADTRSILGSTMKTLVALPPDPKNPYQGQTNAAARLYNWLGSKLGFDPVNLDHISAEDLMNKYRALNPSAFGEKSKSSAGYIVKDISNAIVDAKTADDALRKVLSTTVLSSQAHNDFNRYVPEYRNATGGLSLNLENSFDKDMGQRRLLEQQHLEDAMKPRYVKDASGKVIRRDPAPIEILLKNPSDPSIAKKFDEMYGMPGLARTLIGG